jgi:hypothetical protein
MNNRDAIAPDFIGFICREIALTAVIHRSLIQARGCFTLRTSLAINASTASLNRDTVFT